MKCAALSIILFYRPIWWQQITLGGPTDQETVITTVLRDEEVATVSVTASAARSMWIMFSDRQGENIWGEKENSKNSVLQWEKWHAKARILWKVVPQKAAIIEKFTSTKKATPNKRCLDILGTTPGN